MIQDSPSFRKISVLIRGIASRIAVSLKITLLLMRKKTYICNSGYHLLSYNEYYCLLKHLLTLANETKQDVTFTVKLVNLLQRHHKQAAPAIAPPATPPPSGTFVHEEDLPSSVCCNLAIFRNKSISCQSSSRFSHINESKSGIVMQVNNGLISNQHL